VGQTARVQFGVVSAANEVTLDSNAGGGAIVGGTLGLTMGSGSSSSRRARNAIVGAGVGAAIADASQGNRRGMSYTVAMLDGASLTIVTDQQQIHPGDCVAIEQVAGTSNIRRVSQSYCERTNARAVDEISEHARSEAMACQSAKDELVQAQTQEAIDLATRKIDLLCN
jgi:outer membrane lipoprotein SlyB